MNTAPKVKLSWSIRIGGKLFVFAGAEGDEAEFARHKADMLRRADSAMTRGHSVQHDGKTRWINFDEVHPAQWDRDGQKCLHRVVLCERDDKTKQLTRTVLKTAMRKPDQD
jgi:hypothetical protein